MSVQTLSELFLVAAAHEMPNCIQHKVDGEYRDTSTAELVDRVKRLAVALEAMGVKPGDRVALMAENGPHWPAVDFASLCMGAVLVPVYPTLTPDQAAYVVNDCGAEVLFVQGQERLDGMLGEKNEMPGVRQWVAIDAEGDSGEIITLDAVLASNEPMAEAEFEARARGAKPEDLATFIYTSGTTGNPKGVMLTHGNITSNVLNCLSVMDIEKGWTALSFLPLSHSFERTIDYIYYYKGVSVAYAESVATVAQNMGEVKPQVFVSVPRVYEKVLAKVHENVASSSPVKQKIFRWAEATAREALPYRLARKPPTGLAGFKLKMADKLVFGKIKARLGGRFEFAFSGGAPLSKDIAEFFWGAGIQIYEGYGLSETSPVLSVNTSSGAKLGSVGRAIPDTELKIAEDGEILARGPQIMAGYHNLPEETAEAIDGEGWFHTGDIGEIDDQGFLRITDRKKEIIVNAYGKNVAPAPIENGLKASRFIGQAVVIGDRRKMLSALIVPDFETLAAWAQREGITAADNMALISEPRIQTLFEAEIAVVNEKLAQYEQIRLWKLLPEEFTIETGELTPTQKIKRRVIHRKYGNVIESLYEAPADVQPVEKA
jgi:long-chain acyl-CoA synthetase